MSKDVEETLNSRGPQYGKFDDMARMSQNLKHVLRTGDKYAAMEAYQKEALDMIATKIARIICGNPNTLDSWHDIAGYAKLVEDRIDGVSR